MSEVRQFSYRLALALGIWDAEGLMRLMGSKQLSFWRAFYATEPWGYEEEWLRTGTVAATMYNAAPFRGEGAKFVEAKLFVPKRVKAGKTAKKTINLKLLARQAGAVTVDLKGKAK